MKKIFCDVCGEECDDESGWLFSDMPRATTGPETVISLCKVSDCCPDCRSELKKMDVKEILLNHWKSLAARYLERG